MNKLSKIVSAFLLLSGMSILNTSFADNIDENTFYQNLKNKYELTDDQVQNLKDSGLSRPGVTKATHLSSLSGKTVDEVLKMRNEQKMGWGKIAKELNVHPGELGRSVASGKKVKHAERQEMKAQRQEMKAQRKMERKMNRAQNRASRRADKH